MTTTHEKETESEGNGPRPARAGGTTGGLMVFTISSPLLPATCTPVNKPSFQKKIQQQQDEDFEKGEHKKREETNSGEAVSTQLTNTT